MHFFDDLPLEILELILLTFLVGATAHDIAKMLQVSKVMNNEIQMIMENSRSAMDKYRTTHIHKFVMTPVAENPVEWNYATRLPWILVNQRDDYKIYNINQVLDNPHGNFIVPLTQMKTATYDEPSLYLGMFVSGGPRSLNGSYALYNNSIQNIVDSKVFTFPITLDLAGRKIWSFLDCGNGLAAFLIMVPLPKFMSLYIVDMNKDILIEHEIYSGWRKKETNCIGLIKLNICFFILHPLPNGIR